ncbi:MAG TPA: DUF3341 domain-containing protein [Aliidongia sp.]|uniref:DUF3341 domain-containing protein n=1 Tax=Aliidongia sp. TaxID=1914230 RepID=UPI002DDD0118|nr:DUF3341 domain-containing protein [Aliidongia sp.]HEV2673249.1 DUF3341 domain-containing protein [Aliidongia sp.]
MIGLIAEFASEAALVRAVDHLQVEGFATLDAVTPHAIPELDGKLSGPPSAIPLVILIAALVGVIGGFGMEVYASTVSYPIDIGGRPLNSWPAFVPIAFEIGVLLAIAAGFFGFLIANRLPALHVPGTAAPIFRNGSRDGYLVTIRTDDAARLRPVLATLDVVRITEWQA